VPPSRGTVALPGSNHITQARIRTETQEALAHPPGDRQRVRGTRDNRHETRVADRGVVLVMGAKATSQRREGLDPEVGPVEEPRDRTRGRGSLPAGLARVTAAARRSRLTRFTARLHHVDEAALRYEADFLASAAAFDRAEARITRCTPFITALMTRKCSGYLTRTSPAFYHK